MIIEEAGKKKIMNTKGQVKTVDAVVMLMWFQSSPPWARAVSRAGIFWSSVFFSPHHHTYSIHEISSMFGFDWREKKKRRIKRNIISSKGQKSSKRWWRWTLVTVHKESPNFVAILVWLLHLCQSFWPTGFISCLWWWKITPKPHDAMVPERQVTV